MISLVAAPYFFTFHTSYCTMGSKEARNSRRAFDAQKLHYITSLTSIRLLRLLAPRNRNVQLRLGPPQKAASHYYFPFARSELLQSRQYPNSLVRWIFMPRSAGQIHASMPLAHLEHRWTSNDEIGCNKAWLDDIYSGCFKWFLGGWRHYQLWLPLPTECRRCLVDLRGAAEDCWGWCWEFI